MTDRVKGLTITLEKDVRVDDVEYIVNAIKMIKGISSVDLSIVTFDDHINRARIYGEVRTKLFEFIKTELNDN